MNFKYVLKANGMVIECDRDTMIDLVRGSSVSASNSPKEKVQDGLTPWQKAKGDTETATDVKSHVNAIWANTATVADVKRSVATKHNVSISFQAVKNLVNEN